MQAVSRKLIIPLVLSWIAASPSSAQNLTKRIWSETGTTHHGQIEAQHGPAVPATDLGAIDPATMEQLDKR